MSEEDYKLGERKPWPTVLLLSLGPFCTNFIWSLSNALISFLVKKAYNEESVQVLGFSIFVYGIADFMCSFGVASIPICISKMIAQKKIEEAGQIIADCIRFSFLICIFTCATLIPLSKPMLHFLAVPETLISESCKYIATTLSLNFITSIFSSFCCALTVEAKSNLCAIYQVSSILLILAFLSLGFFAFKVSLWASPFFMHAARFLLVLLLGFQFFKGKFAIKPKFGMLFKKFSSHFPEILKNSMTQVLTGFAGVFPPIILIRYTNKAGANAGKAEETAAVLGSFTLVYNLVSMAVIGLVQGFNPAAAYAFTKKNYRRVFQLFFAVLIIPFIIEAIITPMMIWKTEALERIWISNSTNLEYSKKLIPSLYYTNWLYPLSESFTGLLIATGYGIISIISPIARSVGMLIGTFAFYYSSKDRPDLVLLGFGTQDLLLLICSSVCAIIPIKSMLKSMHTERSELISMSAELTN